MENKHPIATLIMPGTLFVLNGATSTGKTSTAKILQNLLPDPNILLGIDHFHLAIPSAKLDLNKPDPDYLAPRQYTKDGKEYCVIEHGQYIKMVDVARFTAVRTFLDNDINVISDELFWQKDTVLTFLNTLQGEKVYMIGMYVDESEGEARATRRDKSIAQRKNYTQVGT